jgi:hypothetical protein
MARTLFAGVVGAVAFASVGSATGDQLPILRSATVDARHVVLQVAVADVRPVQLAVATRRAVDGNGALVAKNVRLRETIQLIPPVSTGVVRWRSRMTIAPGIYFVQVMAVESGGGLTDCPKFLRNCLDHWSNVRRIVVSTSG